MPSDPELRVPHFSAGYKSKDRHPGRADLGKTQNASGEGVGGCAAAKKQPRTDRDTNVWPQQDPVGRPGL